ncbi:glycosyltransferase family 2 protein [Lacibacter sp. MH-610]|uniref:glycosyltransferase family 2 protein n=1 Tax=Lacibacter sp. MH-610 TaxID=3020883 RepID=UPI0038918D82
MTTPFKILLALLLLLQAVLAIYLLLPSLLLLIHYVNRNKKLLLTKKYPRTIDKEFDFAAIVTAHKDTRFIAPLVDSFLKQRYKNFALYIVADDCDIAHFNFNDDRVVLLKPEAALHAKIKSIKYAVDHFIRGHEVIVVFDSDNLVHPDYFLNLNQYFCRGFEAVQTHMLSKNTDTIYSRLDSIGHIYNTFVERQSRMELGLSSSILGLGIAVKTDLYKQVMYKDALGGFDKKLQADIIRIIPQLAFAKDAYVYDEKVDDGATFERQRTRWIYTYFKYFSINWKLLVYGLKSGNFNKFFFAFTTLKPPLFIKISLAFVFLISGYFIHPLLSTVWAVIILIFTASFISIILTQSTQKGMGRALLYIPAVVFRQMKAFLKLKQAGKDFLKTEHSKIVYIDDVLKHESA